MIHTQKEMLQQDLDNLRKLEEPSKLMEESAPDEASFKSARKAIQEIMQGQAVLQGLHDKAVALERESADRSGPHGVTESSYEDPSEEGISEAQTPLRLPRRILRHPRPQMAEIVVEVQPETSLDLSLHRPYRVGVLRTTRTLDTCTGLESISISAKLFAVTMSSSFLGGLCGIRGPPTVRFLSFTLVISASSSPRPRSAPPAPQSPSATSRRACCSTRSPLPTVPRAASTATTTPCTSPSPPALCRRLARPEALRAHEGLAGNDQGI